MLHACSECGQQQAQWAGRCPGCGAWGTIREQREDAAGAVSGGPVVVLDGSSLPERRLSTGVPGVDRVLGGGLVPASVVLLAGEPGIGKSTLLLQLVAHMSGAGLSCLLASGEESREQIAGRAHRLGIGAERVAVTEGRELETTVATARSERPALLAVDSIQALRDSSGGLMPGGPSQVRGCADALIGLAKTEGIAVLMTGHVTKDGDLAGPRALEHAVDVVLSFEGDPRSGLRMLSGGKNRFGREGEIAWFEMEPSGLREVDPAGFLNPRSADAGSATALILAGRRALAVEVQALVSPTEGPARRQATGLDPRRFHMVAAVLERTGGIPLGRADLYAAAAGGIHLDDPACDLAVAAALVSAATGVPAPRDAAFVGEVGLTGWVRPAPGLPQRLAAAGRAGLSTVFAPGGSETPGGVRLVPVGHVRDALDWVLAVPGTARVPAPSPRSHSSGAASRPFGGR